MALVSIVVRDHDEALKFFVGALGFTIVEDTYIAEQDKRWVVVAPSGSSDARLLLARASNVEQTARIGNQTGGRVFLFLHTDDLQRDYECYQAKGVEFVRSPREESYGTVAVFRDLYGNLWDLIQPKPSVHPYLSDVETGRLAAKPCCEDMRRQLTFRCEDHDDLSNCPDSLVVFSENSGQFGLRVHDGGSSSIAFRHCPWCGARLMPLAIGSRDRR